jgi:hypothetical protein
MPVWLDPRDYVNAIFSRQLGHLLGSARPVTDLVFKALVFVLMIAALFGLGPIIARSINPDAMKGCDDKHSFIYCYLADWESRR